MKVIDSSKSLIRSTSCPACLKKMVHWLMPLPTLMTWISSPPMLLRTSSTTNGVLLPENSICSDGSSTCSTSLPFRCTLQRFIFSQLINRLQITTTLLFGCTSLEDVSFTLLCTMEDKCTTMVGLTLTTAGTTSTWCTFSWVMPTCSLNTSLTPMPLQPRPSWSLLSWPASSSNSSSWELSLASVTSLPWSWTWWQT